MSISTQFRKLLKVVFRRETSIRGRLTKETAILFLLLSAGVGYLILEQKIRDREAEVETILNSAEAVLHRDQDTILLQFLFGAQGDLEYYLKNLQAEFPRVNFCASMPGSFSVPGDCGGKAFPRQLALAANQKFTVGFNAVPASPLIMAWEILLTPVLWLMPLAAVLFSFFINIRLRSLVSQPVGAVQNQLSQMARGDRSLDSLGPQKVREWAEIKEGFRVLLRYITEIDTVSAKLGRNELARQVAADLKDPVKALLQAADELPEKNKPALQKFLVKIKDVADDLVRSTQTPSPEGDVVIEKQDMKLIGIVDLVKKLVEEKRAEFRDKTNIKIFLEIFPGCDSLKVQVDPDAFTRSLSNVINNGVEAMIRGGRVRVRMRPNPNNREAVIIQVVDEGIGIDSKVLAQVTDRGFTYGKPQGLGLGLSFAKSCIEQFNGDITIESRKGAGTTVSLGLPIAFEEAPVKKHTTKLDLGV